jgi:hypothetical protein
MSQPSVQVTRFEVIDANGRVLVANPTTIKLSYQDDGRTLKVFVEGTAKYAAPVRELPKHCSCYNSCPIHGR